jgi:hypothetical protein
VDVARDGGGGLVYVKREGGVPEVFLSRLTGGAFRAPERISSGVPVTEAVISAVDGNRLAIAWIAGGDVWGTVIEGGAPAPAAQLSSGGGATGLAIDMGINGAAYVVWAQPGAGGSDVRAARLQGGAWSAIASPLDIDPNASAGRRPGTSTGEDPLRPRVAVSAEGNAVATWGETHPDGRTHVFARRLTGLNLSVVPQDLTLPDFEGGPGGSADSPDIDIEDDGSFAWVVFRQDIGGRSRSIARRLVGSLFETPAAVDGGSTSGRPRIDFNGRGIGHAVAAAADNTVVGAYLNKFEAFDPGGRIDGTGSGGAPAPVVATSERGDAAVAWRVVGADGNAVAKARIKAGEGGFTEEVLASKPDAGPVAENGVAIGTDRSGNVAVATLQGAAGARWISVGVHDRVPGRPLGLSSSNYQKRGQPRLKWLPGSEQWGPQQFKVFIDGQEVGTTDQSAYTHTAPINSGAHRWQVVAVDRRGQQARGRTKIFRVDPDPPTVKVTVRGERRAGRVLKIRARVRDKGGAGLKSVTIDFGDRSRRVRDDTASHRYRRGKFTLTVRAVDKAGNVGRRAVTLRIKG